MGKFKVGDKVEILYNFNESEVFGEVVGVENSATQVFPVKVRLQTGSEGWHKESELILGTFATPEEQWWNSLSEEEKHQQVQNQLRFTC